MKKTKHKIVLILSFLTFIFASCEIDNKPLPPNVAENYQNGLLILNEGLFQQNNASISFYSLQNHQPFTQAFELENNRGLGDTANDFVKYTLDGKEYIIVAVNVSSVIEIIEAKTLKSVAQIPLFDGTNPRQPRKILVAGYAAYVCNFDGTVSVIDLLNYQVVKNIEVGANPDGMIQFQDKLFVSNSGGLNFPIYDSTMSVIDMSTREVIDEFQTRINCTSMFLDAENEIYLISNGNYSSVEKAILRIDANTHSIIETVDIPIGSATQVNDVLYWYDEEAEVIKAYNLLTEEISNNTFIDLSGFTTFSGIQFIDELNTFYCFDANGYVNTSQVKAYDLNGNYLYEFNAELNANKIIFND